MTDETLRAAHPGNGYRVLDVGCGRAMDAASLAQKGGVLFGCEPSRVMLRKATEQLKKTGEAVILVSSRAEDLPFANGAFDRVVCKGAIDHFINPEQAISEMGRVTSPAGQVVISVANFGSLSCLLGLGLSNLFRRLFGKEIPGPHIWEIPADHTYKFDFASIMALVRRNLRVERIQGVSLFWGFPRWPKALQKLPRPVGLILLRFLDKIASWHPPWSDVLIISGKPFPKNDEERGKGRED
jgi:SAM-dependent methyltransferase